MTERLVPYTVGEPWPDPAPGDGMRAILGPAEEAGLSLILAAGCDKPSAAELAAFGGPVRLAVLSSPPLVWIVLDAGKISWDAPYSPALAGPEHGREIRAGAARAAAQSDELRALADLVLVDRGRVAHLRTATVSRAWWRCLAAAIAACPETIAAPEYRGAIARDQARWTTAQMLAAAAIVETPGRI